MNESTKNDFQQLLNKAALAVYEQGCKSSRQIPGGGTTCVYRGDKHTKCAVGHLISDEQMKKYNIQEKDSPYDFSPELLKELAPHTLPEEVSFFLRRLQCVHDNIDLPSSNFKEDFAKDLAVFAKECELVNPLPIT